MIGDFSTVIHPHFISEMGNKNNNHQTKKTVFSAYLSLYSFDEARGDRIKVAWVMRTFNKRRSGPGRLSASVKIRGVLIPRPLKEARGERQSACNPHQCQDNSGSSRSKRASSTDQITELGLKEKLGLNIYGGD